MPSSLVLDVPSCYLYDPGMQTSSEDVYGDRIAELRSYADMKARFDVSVDKARPFLEVFTEQFGRAALFIDGSQLECRWNVGVRVLNVLFAADVDVYVYEFETETMLYEKVPFSMADVSDVFSAMMTP